MSPAPFASHYKTISNIYYPLCDFLVLFKFIFSVTGGVVPLASDHNVAPTYSQGDR